MKDGTIGNQQRSLELRLSWMGGIIDGEGTITLGQKWSPTSRQKGYHFRPEFKMTNSCEMIVKEFTSILDEFGCAYYVKNLNQPSKTKENWKPYTRITVEGIKRLAKFLPIISPYLISKKEQAELVLEYINSRLAGSQKDPVSDEQLAIVLKIRQLNHRGVLNRPETIRRRPPSEQSRYSPTCDGSRSRVNGTA